MQKIIGVTDLQRRFRTVFDEVAESDTAYVLTRGSRPEAALIPYEQFLQFQAWQEQEVLTRFDQLMARLAHENANVPDEEAAAAVAQARASARAELDN